MVVFNLNKPKENIKLELVYKVPDSNKYQYTEINSNTTDQSGIFKVLKFLRTLSENSYVSLLSVQDSNVLASVVDILKKKDVSKMITLFEILDYIYENSKFNLLELFVWQSTVVRHYGINNPYELIDYFKNNKYNTYYFVYSKSIEQENPTVWKSLQLQGVTKDDVINEERNLVFLGQFFIDLLVQGDSIAISKLADLDESFVRHKVARQLLIDYIDKNNLPDDIMFTPQDLLTIQDELDTPELLFEQIDLVKLGKYVRQKMDLRCTSHFYNNKNLIQMIFEF